MTIATELAIDRKASRTVDRREFVRALDAAQRAGVTVDTWFRFNYADPDLSARADWAGLTAV